MTIKNAYLGQLSYREYDAIPAIRGGFLSKFAKSCPANVWTEDKDTAAMQFGRKDHDYSLRGHEYFFDQYVTPEPCKSIIASKSSERYGEACGNPGTIFIDGTWYCGRHWKGEQPPLDIEIVQPEEIEQIRAMHAATMAHPYAADLYKEAKFEHAITWIDPETGLACKSMIDILPNAERLGGVNIHVNRKTCASAEDRAFYYSAKDKLYHMSSAMSMEGLEIVTGKKWDFGVYICVEKEAPYRVEVHDLQNESPQRTFKDDQGELQFRDILDVTRKRGAELFHKYMGMIKLCMDVEAGFISNGVEPEKARHLAWPHYKNPGSSELGAFLINQEDQ